MEGTAMPQDTNDYERLVASTPNNSFLWIQYMTHQISLMEFDVARSVAERALKRIHFREESERLNVWVAYLNLEHNYGDDVSFDTLHKRALQNNDRLKLMLRLVDAMQKSKAYVRCEKMYKKMLKKYGSKTTKVWEQYGRYLHDTKDVSAQKGGSAATPRDALKSALARLEKSEHVDLIVKFAQMEFSHGGAEYGRTMYEGVITNYPKRLDVWNVYVDQEIKLNESRGRRSRQLFERMITLKLSSKKMQFVFKKYLTYEAKNGTLKKQERVKQLAREWVARKAQEE
jgi:rRNA biogenesis protein RRP5